MQWNIIWPYITSAIYTYLLNNEWTSQLSCNISYFLQILTEKGVFEEKAKTAVTHASNEKIRRQELFDSFQVLGTTLMSEELLHKTNRYEILKLVIIKMSTLYLTE
jgi:flagellar biosynthesis protein FliP